MAQRISRAKQRIRDAGATFTMPPPDALEERLRAVLHVLYLIVNEGYTSSSGPEVDRPDPTRGAMLNRALAVAMVHGPDAGSCTPRSPVTGHDRSVDAASAPWSHSLSKPKTPDR